MNISHVKNEMKKMSGMQTVLTQPEFCSHGGLLHRGWTKSAIEKFLATHDKEVPNPHYPKSYPMKLYLLERVVKAETSQEYQDFCGRNRTRREASVKAIKTKQNNLLKQVARWEIYIQPQHLEDVMHDAIKSYNSVRVDRSEDGFPYEPASMNSDKEFLKRIVVNFLRHCCSPYERRLDEITGKVGTKEAYILLNHRIYKRISELYPELKDECDRQFEEKTLKTASDPMYIQEVVTGGAFQTKLND